MNGWAHIGAASGHTANFCQKIQTLRGRNFQLTSIADILWGFIVYCTSWLTVLHNCMIFLTRQVIRAYLIQSCKNLELQSKTCGWRYIFKLICSDKVLTFDMGMVAILRLHISMPRFHLYSVMFMVLFPNSWTYLYVFFLKSCFKPPNLHSTWKFKR